MFHGLFSLGYLVGCDDDVVDSSPESSVVVVCSGVWGLLGSKASFPLDGFFCAQRSGRCF